MHKFEVPQPILLLSGMRDKLRSKTMQNIDYYKVAVAGMMVVAILSGTLVLISHQNRQISNMRSQMHTNDVNSKRMTSQLESRTKRNALKIKKVAHVSKSQLSQHSVSKRSANRQEDRVQPQYSSVGGAVYVHWGRMDCPNQGPSKIIYSGMGAGALQGHTGGGNLICIHRNASYNNGQYRNGFSGSSHIYGLEWRDAVWINILFDMEDVVGRSLQYHSVPCALCMASRRHGQVTIHGQSECPEGWVHEYDGYIMSAGHSDKHSTEYICVDRRPQVVPGTQGSQGGSYLFMVETQCASLLCEPIVAGREIRCVVCTI